MNLEGLANRASFNQRNRADRREVPVVVAAQAVEPRLPLAKARLQLQPLQRPASADRVRQRPIVLS